MKKMKVKFEYGEVVRAFTFEVDSYWANELWSCKELKQRQVPFNVLLESAGYAVRRLQEIAEIEERNQ